METDDLCQYLEWDSEFFGLRIARVAVGRLTRERMQHILRWCDAHRIDCLYFLSDADDPPTVRLAEDHRFRFVDIRVTFENRLATARPGAASAAVRVCRPGDVPFLRAIARNSHRDSRFYFDANFPRSRCDALYEAWIDKSCGGGADAVLVVERERRPAGYICCHVTDEGHGEFGLVAVDADARRRGLGQALVDGSLRWFRERRVEWVTVVTQGRNCRAQRLYQRAGFVSRAVQLWYHGWLTR